MSQFLDQLVEFAAILLEKFGVVFFQVVCATVGVIAALVFGVRAWGVLSFKFI